MNEERNLIRLRDEPDLPSQINIIPMIDVIESDFDLSRSILKWQIAFLAKDFERIRYDYLGKRAN